MFQEQHDGIIIDIREDRRLAIVVACVDVRTELEQLLFYIGQEISCSGVQPISEPLKLPRG